VLIGTNSDEGALFIQGKVPPAAFEQTVRSGFGKGAETILQAYPHATEADASAAARNLMRESTFAWHTWAWAMLQSEKGKGKAFVYYYDHRTPQQPNGASHGAEIPYVFRTLGAPGANLGGPVAAPRPEDLKMSELMSSYWTNFAKTGNPNGPGLPVWPEFSVKDQRVMFLDDTQSGARPVPNIEQLKALESYYAWRRSEGKGGLVR
jgi:para-nitrobenzyl esterase